MCELNSWAHIWCVSSFILKTRCYNSGVCVSCVDDDNNEMEYYGVIKDIIKIKWEGSLPLEMVLFDCDWFDPTPSGTKRTENLGLVEVKHATRLLVSTICNGKPC